MLIVALFPAFIWSEIDSRLTEKVTDFGVRLNDRKYQSSTDEILYNL